MINNIYLDMDGVIANFDKGYSAIYGLNCRDDPNDNHWYEFVANNGFYNLETCEEFDILINKLNTLKCKLNILSCAGTRSNYEDVKEQKIKWLEKNNLGHLHSIFTKTKLEKSNYANDSSLLIDDSVPCIDPFKNKGGYGILHQTVSQTISQLDCLKKKGYIFE